MNILLPGIEFYAQETIEINLNIILKYKSLTID